METRQRQALKRGERGERIVGGVEVAELLRSFEPYKGRKMVMLDIESREIGHRLREPFEGNNFAVLDPNRMQMGQGRGCALRRKSRRRTLRGPRYDTLRRRR